MRCRERDGGSRRAERVGTGGTEIVAIENSSTCFKNADA